MRKQILGRREVSVAEWEAAVESYSTVDTVETMTLFWDEVEKHVLQDFLGYNSKQKNVS